MRLCTGSLVVSVICLTAGLTNAASPEGKDIVSSRSVISPEVLPRESNGAGEILGQVILRVAQNPPGTQTTGSSTTPSNFARQSDSSDATESTRDKRENKKLVRKLRSKPAPFDIAVSTNQRVLVKKFNTKESNLVGDYWLDDSSKADEKERIAQLVDYQIHRRLRGLGFRTIPYQEAVDEGMDMKNALVVEGEIGIITKGIDHPLITASVRVVSADDPGKVYSTFVDGGMLGQVTTRIRGRFMKSLPRTP